MSVRLFEIIVLQWLHVLCAIFWFGSTLYANVVLWPAMRTLPSEHEAALLTTMRTGLGRKTTLVVAFGTVGLGILRGIAGGVLGRLDSLYGVTFLAAALLGVTMVAWVVTRGFGRPNLSWLFLPSFFVMFSLMIAMRFGY
jgi:uncharacterized membrane protein